MRVSICVFKLVSVTLTEPAVMAAERLMRAPGAVPDTTQSLHVHTGSTTDLPELQRVNARPVPTQQQHGTLTYLPYKLIVRLLAQPRVLSVPTKARLGTTSVCSSVDDTLDAGMGCLATASAQTHGADECQRV